MKTEKTFGSRIDQQDYFFKADFITGRIMKRLASQLNLLTLHQVLHTVGRSL